VEKLLETEASKRLGLNTPILVRTAADLVDVVAKNPFPDEAKNDPGHLVVGFLRDAPDAKAVKALQAAIVGREVVRAIGRHAYTVFPDGIGRSKLTNVMVEKKLDTISTGRNWNTVLKLHALATA